MAQDLEKTDENASPKAAASEAGNASNSPTNENFVENAAKSVEATSVRSNWFSRYFWLDGKLAEATSASLGPTQTGWREFELAREGRTALEEVAELGESNFQVLLIARSEVLLLLRCHLLQAGLALPKFGLSAEDWDRAREVPLVAEIWNNFSTNKAAIVTDCLGPEGEAYLIGLGSPKRAELIVVLKEMASTLMKPLESDASKIGRVLAQRWLRVGVAVAIVGLSLWNLSRWAFDRAGTVNLALKSFVTISSPAAEVALDHRSLVDGDRTNLGFHTDCAANQFVVIDLGSVKKFDKVVVYNRADCCKERAVPLVLEVSEDRTKYKKLAERKEVFDVWTSDMLRARGRYVRLSSLNATCFHLSEVEIY